MNALFLEQYTNILGNFHRIQKKCGLDFKLDTVCQQKERKKVTRVKGLINQNESAFFVTLL